MRFLDPELADVMADLYYYRSIANRKTAQKWQERLAKAQARAADAFGKQH